MAGADFPSCLEGAEKQYVESLWQVRGNLSTEIEQSEDLLDQAYEKRELHQDQQWVESYINSLRDVIAAAQILAVLEPEERFATVDAEEEKATEKLMDSAEMQGHWLDTQNDEYLANSASLKLEAYEIWAANDSSIWAMCQ